MRSWLLACSLAALSSGWLPAVAQAPSGADRRPDLAKYEIGIEDKLKILVWGEDALGTTQTVRPDGRITVPLANDVEVAGLTPEQVRERIAKELGKFIKDPNVTVMVEEINSYRVFFLGEIQNQGPIQFYRPTRLLQALASAGGLTEFAKKEVVVLREIRGIENRIEIDYKRLWAGETGTENLLLLPGDTVLVK